MTDPTRRAPTQRASGDIGKTGAYVAVRTGLGTWRKDVSAKRRADEHQGSGTWCSGHANIKQPPMLVFFSEPIDPNSTILTLLSTLSLLPQARRWKTATKRWSCATEALGPRGGSRSTRFVQTSPRDKTPPTESIPWWSGTRLVQKSV